MAKHIKLVEERKEDGTSEYSCPKCDSNMGYIFTSGNGDGSVDHYTCENPDCRYSEDEFQAWERNKKQIIKSMKREFEMAHQHEFAVANNLCITCGVKVA